MLEQLIKDLKQYDPKEVCYKTGVSNATLYAITTGRNDNPKIKTIEALQKFVDEKRSEQS